MMFASRMDTTPRDGRPRRHPSWHERPYINERDCFVGLRATRGDTDAARELEIRNANRDRHWHEAGWPRWEKKA